MNKIAVSVAAITTLVASHALAADMAVKSAPVAPAPAVYNWTGWYVGVNAGASMGNAKTDFNLSPVGVCSGDCNLNDGHSFSDTRGPSGFIGGGQIGYNWQYSPLIVVGLEADIQGALERDRVDNWTHSFSDFDTSSTQVFTSYTTQIDWFGTARARLGYLWGNGEVLSYVTGGLAYGEVKINGTNTVNAACCGDTGNVTQTFSASKVNTGWTLGYGTEGHLPGNWLPGNWTWKVETLYMDLGHLDSAGVTTGSCCVVHGGQVTTNTHFTDWILRGGLNYQFH